MISTYYIKIQATIEVVVIWVIKIGTNVLQKCAGPLK